MTMTAIVKSHQAHMIMTDASCAYHCISNVAAKENGGVIAEEISGIEASEERSESM